MTTPVEKKDLELPDDMAGYIKCGMTALSHGGNIPKDLVKICSGAILAEAGEGGFFLSAQGGNGVALQHKDGKWSNPIAVNLMSMGGGAVFGYANKCVIILLSPWAMDNLLKGDGSMSIGVDAGFAVGKVGKAAAAGLGISNKGGLGSSLVYTYSNGLLFSVEALIGARINPPDTPNKNFYGTSSYPEILNGEAAAPEGSQVPALLEALDAFENGPEHEDNK